MRKTTDFGNVLEAAQHFSPDTMDEIADILHKRAIEIRRKELAADIKSARAEHKNNRTKVMSAGAIARELAL